MTDIWGAPLPTRTNRAAFLPSPVFLGIVAVFAGTGWGLWSGVLGATPGVLLFVLSGWLVSLCLHEYAHALIAYLSGDRSVAAAGYLTLNPFKYTHAVFSIALPLLFVLIGGIGMPGGAVYVDHRAIRSRLRMSLVSAAGPLTNAAFALATLLPVSLIWTLEADHQVFWKALAFLGLLQIMATLLNILPVPGLDGFGIIQPWLSPRAQEAAAKAGAIPMIVLFLLLFAVDAVQTVFFGGVSVIRALLGVDPYLPGEGYDLFAFWR